MNLFHSLFLFLSLLPYFSPILSYAQLPDSTSPVTTTSSPSSGSNVSSSPASTNSTASSTPTTFANLTTTNSQGSTIVTSVPITVGPSTTPSTTSSAPFPSLTGYPTCVTNCLTDAVAQVNCSSITAVACYCTNQTFPAALYACVASNCGANVPSAENLAQRFCSIDNVTLSFASTAALSSSSSSSPPTTKPSSFSSSTPSNAAHAMLWMPDGRGWSGVALAACGAVFGAALL